MKSRHKTAPRQGGRTRGAKPRARVAHYLDLARAAEAAGDAVAAQNYYQHAEHYVRQSGGK